MCPFFTIPFFAWHHTETVLVLHQTPLKLHVFTSEVSTMQIMALFHLTLNPWQQSCLDHTARTGTRAMAVSVLHAQASAMQQQIVFIQTTYLKNKSGVSTIYSYYEI